MQSLHGFCKAYDLPKTSVRRWLNDAGYDTSNGLTDDAIGAALGEFKPSVLITEESTSTDTSSAISFHTGNHRSQLSLPQQPELVDLGELRGENAALASFEPEDIDRFLDACDGFLDAVEADWEHQRAVTRRKELAASKVRAKVDEVKQARLKYQLRSETLALHNRGIDAELQAGMTELGKPAAGGESPQ